MSRVALLYLLLSAAYVGLWAQFSPSSFYSEFPSGRGWIAADGAFNEHLIRDVGSLNLAMAAITVVAIVARVPWRGAKTARRDALRVSVAFGWFAYSVPHLIYHLDHGEVLSNGDRWLNGASLSLTCLAALVLLADALIPTREPLP